MLIENLQILLLSFIPGLIYLCIAYITTPYNSWDFKKSLLYLIGGTLSVPIILTFMELVPSWNLLYINSSKVVFFQLLMMSFIQIAFFEELIKYFLFLFFRKKVIPIKIKHHPLSIMVYGGAVSLGFAFTENILYAARYGSEVLYMRGISAVIIHMMCGMMMGYFISLSKFHYKLKTNPTDSTTGTSIFDIIMQNNPKIRNYFYIFLGIGIATFFHGIYDFNLISVIDFGGNLPDTHLAFTIQTIILMVGFYTVKKMMNHLVKLNIKLNLDSK
jgi:RsiW-degrading membrane proteinase PrsW (M82 family)